MRITSDQNECTNHIELTYYIRLQGIQNIKRKLDKVETRLFRVRRRQEKEEQAQF